jgi:hypothetical protein
MDDLRPAAKSPARKPARSRSAADRKVYGRSAVSNGKDVLPHTDGRSLIVRRFRDVASALLADAAGEDQCSEARRQLIRRFAAGAVLAEQLESRLANGEQIDVSEWALLSSTLTRLAGKIGIDRRQKPVPTLDEYLKQQRDMPEAAE